jgi:hypothetical protein
MRHGEIYTSRSPPASERFDELVTHLESSGISLRDPKSKKLSEHEKKHSPAPGGGAMDRIQSLPFGTCAPVLHHRQTSKRNRQGKLRSFKAKPSHHRKW